MYFGLGGGLHGPGSTSCRHFDLARLVRLYLGRRISKMSVEFIDPVLGVRQLVL